MVTCLSSRKCLEKVELARGQQRKRPKTAQMHGGQGAQLEPRASVSSLYLEGSALPAARSPHYPGPGKARVILDWKGRSSALLSMTSQSKRTG